MLLQQNPDQQHLCKDESIFYDFERQVIEQLLLLRMSNPETMKELAKRLTNVDSVLQRMTIIGVILSFRSLLTAPRRFCRLALTA